jgi:uncharacterized protein YcaQ
MPDARHFRRLMDTVRILQLDFVNVLMPAHYLVAWSRLGAYDVDRLLGFLYGSGDYTEHWAHEASIIPAAYWPALDYRRRAHKPWRQSPVHLLDDLDGYLQALLERIGAEGPLTASDFDDPLALERREGDWHRSLPRHALEVHFGRGSLAVRTRLPNFQRVYDLPERVLPGHHDLPAMDKAAAHRLLLADAARAFGVATASDLVDYFRMSPRVARPLLEDLVEMGALRPVRVEGWREDSFLSRQARLPRIIPGASLVSPFDPLVWFRPRAERLFGFRYRIEIYVPEAQREWGYYVLPFRYGDRLVGRLDLKADRKTRTLLVRKSYVEQLSGLATGEVAAAMARELTSLAEWLELDGIDVTRHNAFSRQLAGAVRLAAGPA